MTTDMDTTPKTFSFHDVAEFEQPIQHATEACRAAMLIAWHGESQGLTDEDAGGLRFVLDAAIEQLEALQAHFRELTAETRDAADA